MGKDKSKSKTKSETLEITTQLTVADPPSTERPETPEPESTKPIPPKFTGPLIAFRNLDVKSGGVISVHCLDNKVPLGKIQIIQIKAGDATYVYRRI